MYAQTLKCVDWIQSIAKSFVVDDFAAVRAFIVQRKLNKTASPNTRASVPKAEGCLIDSVRTFKALKRNGRGGGIRTPGPLLPKQIRSFMETC
jgi:hypothetical protein